MPLNRPALSLGSGPRGVQDARRWVVDTCHDIGRSDLVECAELGVSELVTNALLHAFPPLTVRVRGTREHPRVEVRDGSTEVPAMPGGETHDEDDLLCGQRLLSILRTPPRGDAWIILAHQYIAASLNVASGASSPSSVDGALADASAFLLANCGGAAASAAPEAIALAELLDSYNHGAIGPGHCD